MGYALDMASRDRLADLIEGGATARECQAALSIALGTVYRWASELGLTPRTPRESAVAVVVELVAENWTAAEIVAMTGLGKSRVYAIASQHRLRLHRLRGKPRADVIRLARKGLSAAQIAGRTGLTPGGVLYHAARNGLTLVDGRKRGDAMAAAVAAGDPIKRVARQNNVVPKQLRKSVAVRKLEAVA